MHLVVVGAGIGGLAAAVALRRQGHQVTVVERAAELSEVGAGVVLGPHAMRALQWLGADGHIRAINDRPDRLSMLDMISGDHRVRFDLGDTGAQLYGADLYTTHRRDLIDALANQLETAHIMLGRTLTGLSQDDTGVNLTLDDGTALRCDALIGADGLKSTVRSALFGPSDAEFSGFLAWRTVLSTDKLVRPLPNTMTVWMGCGRHIVFYPIRKGKQFYAAFYVPADEIHREDWSASGNVEELRQSFSDAEPAVRELVGCIDEAFITGIFYREPLERWHDGRIVLIGDAAHPVLPTSGSGAGMALEDSVTLARVLEHHPEDVPAAFCEFQARRKDRTSRLLISSKADLIAFQEENPVKIAYAARIAKGVGRLDPSGRERMLWLYGHDEPATSARPLHELQADNDCKLERSAAREAFAAWQGAMAAEDSVDGWISERAAHDRFVEKLGAIPNDVSVEWIEEDGVRGYRVTPQGCENGPALLHLHGGYLVYGTAKGSIPLAARMATALSGWAFIPEFRLAPEQPSAGSADDVAAAYRWIVRKSGTRFISAEDASAVLALGLAPVWEAEAIRPEALFFISPLVDLTLSGRSLVENGATDPWAKRARLVSAIGAFIGDRDAACDGVSHYDLDDLPPLHIFAAANEALIDDARLLVDAARAAGISATLTQVADSVHRYPLFEFLPETQSFLEELSHYADTTVIGR